MSMGNVTHELSQGVPVEAATSVPRGVIRIASASASDGAGILIGVVSGAISSLCTATSKFMPGCIMFDTAASVSNDAECNIASSITATPSWVAITNA